MSAKLFQTTIAFLLSAFLIVPAQSRQFVCKTQALAARRPVPELKYDCNEDLTDSDDKVLTQSNRVKAIDLYTESLEKLADSDWWKTSVEDLNVCDFRQKAGALSEAEKRQYEGGEYFFKLRGNDRFRVIVARDPCYQTGFNGANIFLLNRAGGKVFASEIIDGFYTRSDAPLGFDTAANGDEQIIEIATTSGGLYPTETFYYFTIDKKTNRAVPKNLFKGDAGKMSNQMQSMMLLGEPEEYGLPPKSESLRIIKSGRLMKSFDIFIDTGETSGEDNRQKFTKQTLRWNGKFYE